MLSFGTGFVLGWLFRDTGNKRLLKEKNPVKSWWEYHTSLLYSDVENECVKKWAVANGYDIKTDENIIKTLAYTYKGYGEVLELMLECAKEKKKKAKGWKSWTKKKEARLLIKMIKKYQKINNGVSKMSESKRYDCTNCTHYTVYGTCLQGKHGHLVRTEPCVEFELDTGVKECVDMYKEKLAEESATEQTGGELDE